MGKQDNAVQAAFKRKEVLLLREATSAGITDCILALELHAWNFEAAAKHLRTKGLAVVVKGGNR